MYADRLADMGLGDFMKLGWFEERIERVLVQSGTVGVSALLSPGHRGEGMQAAGCTA